MRHRLVVRALRVVTGVVLGLGITYWVLRPTLGRTGDESEEYFLAAPLSAPSFTLTSQAGRKVGVGDFPGKLVVVFFGYTSCPDVCPLTLSNLSRVLREMGPAADRIQVLFITVDPDRDTPERLAAYLEAFDPTFVGLTGTEEEIRSVATDFGVYFAKHGEGPSYTVDHTARTYVIDPQGRIPLTFPTDATPGAMVRAFTRLLEETS
jgi:protein SCO1/2